MPQKVDEMDEKSKLLVKQETYLEAGIHIGTKIRTHDMKRFIFKRRDDDLFVLDLRKIDERLLQAAKMLAKYEPEDILVVASRMYSSNAAAKFSNLTGIPLIKGRFVPGTMTNLSSSGFREPKIVFVCDPKGEKEAIVESAKNGVPLISLCDTDNETKFIDLVVPANNKGKKSLALVFFILAREYLVSRGVIPSYTDFKYDVIYFEQMDYTEDKKTEVKPVEVATPEPVKPEEPKKEPVQEQKKE